MMMSLLCECIHSYLHSAQSNYHTVHVYTQLLAINREGNNLRICSTDDSNHPSKFHSHTPHMWCYPAALQINTVFLGFALVALGRSKKQKTKALDKDKSVKQAT